MAPVARPHTEGAPAQHRSIVYRGCALQREGPLQPEQPRELTRRRLGAPPPEVLQLRGVTCQATPHELLGLPPLCHHLSPRVPPSRQLAVHDVAQATTCAFALPHHLLPLRMPAHPSKRQVAVHQVPHCSGDARGFHRLEGGQPAHEGRGQLAARHERHAAPNEPKRLPSLRRHLHPRVPACRKLAVHQEPHAALNHLERLLPLRCELGPGVPAY
mmetsp:Transcript_21277/g.50745  ORF Transcript_21277/g.50745 Transcript_21277/m.50745 type:complete len:215 (-) Transcript_21277:79-723(-)